MGKFQIVQYAAHIEVDNSQEDPDLGRTGLREELLPVLCAIPEFNSTLLLTAYERGRGVAVIVFETRVAANNFINSLRIGQVLREGVTVTSLGVFEVTARA